MTSPSLLYNFARKSKVIMTKQELEKNKELARLYYMNGDTQKLVAEKTGMSRVTINKWVNEGGWEAMRMAKQITRQELVTKMMQEASKKLEDGGMSCDELSKLSAAVKGIDRQANPVTVIEVMTIYNEWLVATKLNLADEKKEQMTIAGQCH